MQPRAHGAYRASDRGRRVFVAQFLQVAQHDDLAVRHREIEECEAESGHVPLPRQLDDRVSSDREPHMCTAKR